MQKGETSRKATDAPTQRQSMLMFSGIMGFENFWTYSFWKKFVGLWLSSVFWGMERKKKQW